MAAQKIQRIFVSHSHVDNEFGSRLVRDLRGILGKEGEVWYDSKGGIQPKGAQWSRIVRALEVCDVFLLIVSPDSMGSEWVIREYDIALNGGKWIIPLFYRKCKVRADIKMIQGISFLSPRRYGNAFNELIRGLGWEVVADELQDSIDE